MGSYSKRLIRLPEVMSKTGFSKAWIYRLIRKKHFPSPIKTGSRSIAFVESEVDGWIELRIAESRGESA
ncbi:helix-turn-helix transcriptional regulator [Pectobacterium versatile]|uniref:helix-turn-helix transcriptional regulator n=1 Tax=Pectobacterium versatile TaxID=2488639 RepID=UPI00380A165E